MARQLWLEILAMALAVTAGVVVAVRAVPSRAQAAPGPAALTEPVRPQRAPITPIARPAPQDPARVALGRALFADRRISEDSSIACRDCHDVGSAGADGRTVAIGIGGRLGTVNTPTVFNADGNAAQFWDGRALTLEAQIEFPLQNPNEMGTTWSQVIARLQSDAWYVDAFRTYPAGITRASIEDAIATYERTLVTPDSRFDRFLQGEPLALSEAESRGWSLFRSYGCISCHQGSNVGGNLFERLGIMGDYFADRGGPIVESDLGRFNVTKLPEDRYRFRVPSLRLVARTAPYLHDGRTATLTEAITLMGKYQLGVELPPGDVASITAFLGSLAAPCEAPVPLARD